MLFVLCSTLATPRTQHYNTQLGTIYRRKLISPCNGQLKGYNPVLLRIEI